MMVEAVTAGLTVDQFWAYTPFEIKVITKAFAKKDEINMNYLAWVASHIMNSVISTMGGKGSKTVTPKRLLGKIRSIDSFDSLAEFNKFAEGDKK